MLGSPVCIGEIPENEMEVKHEYFWLMMSCHNKKFKSSYKLIVLLFVPKSSTLCSQNIWNLLLCCFWASVVQQGCTAGIYQLDPLHHLPKEEDHTTTLCSSLRNATNSDTVYMYLLIPPLWIIKLAQFLVYSCVLVACKLISVAKAPIDRSNPIGSTSAWEIFVVSPES